MLETSETWQRFTRDAEQAIVEDTKCHHDSKLSIANWLNSGAFVLTNAVNNCYSAEIDRQDFSSALVSEAEALLDHVAELRAQVYECRRLGQELWSSPAWLLVTCYYWCFFACEAILRLVGRPISYLGAQESRRLGILAGVNSFGKGAYYFVPQRVISLTKAGYSICRDDLRIHESVWQRFGDYLIAHFAGRKDNTLSKVDLGFKRSLGFVPNPNGSRWMSAFRNNVNYKLFFGFGAVLKETNIDLIKYLRRQDGMTLEDALEESVLIQTLISGDTDNVSSAGSYARLCYVNAVILTSCAEKLRVHIGDRTKGVTLWHTNRHKFLESRVSHGKPSYHWPIRV